MYCTKCGAEIQDEAVICVHCGVAVKLPAHIQTQSQAKPKEQNLTFVFVTSLIFMIIFALGSFVTLLSFVDWRAVRNYDFSDYGTKSDVNSLCNNAVFANIIILVFFAAVLTVFVITASVRSKQGSQGNRVLFSKILFISTILSLGLCLVLIISQISFYFQIDSFNRSISEIRYYIDSDISYTLEYSSASLFFGVVYLAFAITNAVKSWFFFCETKKKTTGDT